LTHGRLYATLVSPMKYHVVDFTEDGQSARENFWLDFAVPQSPDSQP
jgi:hypothetical protein